MRLSQQMRDYIVRSATRVVVIGNYWMSPALLKEVSKEKLEAISKESRRAQEQFVNQLIDSALGRAALRSTVQDVLTAYKDVRSIKFLTKTHVRNIIRLLAACDEEGSATEAEEAAAIAAQEAE